MSDTKIHLCFECGQKNRVPAGNEASALCGGCGQKLYPNLSPTARKPAQQESVYPPANLKSSSAKPASGNSWFIYWFIFPTFAAVLFLGILFSVYGTKQAEPYSYPSTTSSTWEPPSVEVVEPEIALLPQHFDPGVVWDLTGDEPIAPFEIITRTGDSHFVKLVDLDTGQDAMAILVRGGEPLEVDVPLGNYKMKWCSGETWFGEADRFGPDESCSTSNDIFNFRINGDYAEGNSVTLYTVSAGNMDTRRLDPSDF